MIRSTLLRLTAIAILCIGNTGCRKDAEPEQLLSSAVSKIQFNRDVLPVLSDNCFACHGPDKNAQEADLRLDIREDAIAAGAFVPGNSEESLAIQRIFSTHPDKMMPPPDSHLSLSEEQKNILAQWVEQGAEYQPHWAFIPVEPGSVEASIDQIVAASLSEQGYALQPEAEKTTLLRRVYFDLIGLPPTPDEVRAYLEDDSPDAYEQVVDDLLSRPEYGERMAVHWLDLARYADSDGYQRDKDREVWVWKKWVIDAFNRNMPYDDFVTYQLAGDLLPNPTREQRLATAFNRLHQYKNEGGSVEEEFRVEAVVDRTNTFSTAFLGLTMDCARCHDHKYDPVSQKEYYQLYAFFDDIDEAGLSSFFGRSVPTPALALAAPETEEKLSKLLAAKQSARDDWLAAASSIPKQELQTWWAEDPDLFARLQTGNAFDLEDDDEERGRLFNGDDILKTKIGAVSRHEPFTVAFWIWSPEHKERAIICHLSDHWTDAGSRGWELTAHDGKLRFSMIHFWPGNAIAIETDAPFGEKEWIHVTLSYDGSSQAEGMRLYLNGQPAHTSIVRDQLTKFIHKGDFGGKNGQKKLFEGIRWGARARDHGFTGGRVDQAYFFDYQLHPREVAYNADPVSKAHLVGRDWNELGPAERDFVRAIYARDVSEPLSKLYASLKEARVAHGDEQDSVPEILTMQELPLPKRAFVLNRGAYDDRGEEVFAATPAVLPPMDGDLPRNRLGLAKWLLEEEHPLFARVAVNRFWMLCFGRGIVDTPEDFGLQGEQPAYPELIDYLAADFRRSDWNIKALMRQIVSSRTYRQRSFTSPEMMEADPTNRLLVHGPSHRLPAEMIRDNALAVSGLLEKTTEAAPKRPYDLSEAFKRQKVSEGSGVYHRSVYSLWKRSAPPPMMIAFDGVKREVCSAKRATTNTPLQSLILLNAPQFVEAARVAGINAWRSADGDLGEVINDLSLRFISREPVSEEARILSALFAEQRDYYAENNKAARELLSIGHSKLEDSAQLAEFAAVTVLAQTLMNFDEAVVKR